MEASTVGVAKAGTTPASDGSSFGDRAPSNATGLCPYASSIAERRPHSSSPTSEEKQYPLYVTPLSVAEQQQAVESALPAELTRGRLHFVEVPSPLDAVSSSAIRSAIARGDVGAAREMLPACLHDYVESEALFRESD